MPIINRLDPTTWPIGWAPEDEEDWRVLSKELRMARAKAVELRTLLESIADTARTLWEVTEEPVDSWCDSLRDALLEASGEMENLEEWLDKAPLDGEKNPFVYDPDTWNLKA